jgi:two-component system cell cycle sensor histidine kinase/response regulator CckA
VTGTRIHSWIAPDSQRILQSLLSTGENEDGREELVLTAGDGTPVPSHLSVNPLLMDDSQAFLCLVATDLTEKRRAEEALRQSEEHLRQSQKMEAVGQLAGGIAHDFNNLLTAILGYSDLILASGSSTVDEVRPDLEEIKRASERASALTQQILAFSRRQTLRPQVVLLDEIVRGIEPLLRRTIGENIDLHITESPGPASADVDPHQFEQVVMNLVLNARDAMPSGGRLTLETGTVELGEGFCRTHDGATPGSNVMLRISDTGVGMDAATQERIFEPFFTTKAVGAGTGLGLATVYGIVKQSNGSIFVTSEPGRGSSFTLYLPQAAQLEVPKEMPIPSQGPAGGPETVMVVEDEAALRGLIERILGAAGYKTLIFSSPPEALEALKQGEQVVDMLLTDVMLPGPLQGHDLARAILALRPDLPVLYISGYSRDALVHAGRLDEGVNLLEKPFTPKALTDTVREVLDQIQG